ncbi:MAG TPA: FAD-dependent oxidoreductase, partial [Saprospiraceae bacterium]|nr:FAD-dependent oxidoreductase [Saprospiraceae bacterium]
GVEALLRQYDRVVFCEGYRSAHNPYFPALPWQIAKGEALILRFADPGAARLTEMLKKTVTLVPLGDGTCWAGGSYQWHYPDLNPSAGERDYLLAHLRGMLAAPFEVVGQVAGIRPTVRDRRPLLGESPLGRNVFLFNGLGTKGALMGPYWAEHMAAHLLEGLPLDAEVTLSRT